MDSRIIYMCPNYNDYEFKTDRYWRTDGKYEPFVYIIQEVETEIMYIGSKTQYKGAPCLESWLGTKYFTSSKEFDWKSDPSSFEICKIISCASNHDAIILEGLLIKQNGAVWDESYYNMHYPSVGYNNSGRMHSEESRKKMSINSKGRKPSDETRKKMSVSGKGKIFSKEHRRKLSEASRGEKHHKCMLGKPRCEVFKDKISGVNNYQFKGWYVTPWGKFATKKSMNSIGNFSVSGDIIASYCRERNVQEITSYAFNRSKFLQEFWSEDIIGKTYKDIGFSFEYIE